MKIPFAQIDAFASTAFTGNPAAVMPLDAWLADEVLLAIAAENNLAETAFVIPTTGDADFELRWFTPEVEVVLCGHATLASGHYLLTRSDSDVVRFRTRYAGLLEVRQAESGYALDLPAWKTTFKSLPKVCAALGGAPTETRWREGGYAIITYPNEAAVRALDPDFRALKALGDILTIATAPGTDTDIVSRVFAPGAGIDEDPVTGSAHCLLTPYWAERLGRNSFSAFQASKRGGYVACTLDGDRALLGGNCVTVIEGTFIL